jgi:molecular chaperone Hsp33
MTDEKPPAKPAAHADAKSEPGKTDYLMRFHFQHLAIRGAVVKLNNSYVEALNGRDYPAVAQTLLGECLAATLLMAANLKTSARLSLQARGAGPLGLLMAETSLSKSTSLTAEQPDTFHQTLRALARIDTEHAEADALEEPDANLQSLLGRAQLAITMEPLAGERHLENQSPNATASKDFTQNQAHAGRRQERYQGIVGLDDPDLDTCLENYFLRSEQLPTFLKLYAQGDQAAGILIQKIPTSASAADIQPVDNDSWQEVTILASSLKNEELIGLPANEILHRLYHQHDYHTYPPQAVAFACSCSANRTGAALMHIDSREIEEILAADGEIVMDCEFCSARYRFDRNAIDKLNTDQDDTRH